jgi:hypothetical protein
VHVAVAWGFVSDEVAATTRAAAERLAEQLQVDPDDIRSYGQQAKTRMSTFGWCHANILREQPGGAVGRPGHDTGPRRDRLRGATIKNRRGSPTSQSRRAAGEPGRG